MDNTVEDRIKIKCQILNYIYDNNSYYFLKNNGTKTIDIDYMETTLTTTPTTSATTSTATSTATGLVIVWNHRENCRQQLLV